MTDKTETKQAKRPGRWSDLASGFIGTLGALAFFAWLAGVALNKGFGVHVPFMAAWLLLIVGLSILKSAASEVAGTWHAARVKADVTLIAASMAAQEMAHANQDGGFADMLAKLGKVSKDDAGNSPSPYL